jgi:hypothetical protein
MVEHEIVRADCSHEDCEEVAVFTVQVATLDGNVAGAISACPEHATELAERLTEEVVEAHVL